MRTHIENDIHICSSAGGLGFTIDKRSVVDVKEKGTQKVIGQEEKFTTISGGNFVSLAGAINGLLKHKVVSLSNEKVYQLEELLEIVTDHNNFIRSKINI